MVAVEAKAQEQFSKPSNNSTFRRILARSLWRWEEKYCSSDATYRMPTIGKISQPSHAIPL
jgi:hypothetical protein